MLDRQRKWVFSRTRKENNSLQRMGRNTFDFYIQHFGYKIVSIYSLPPRWCCFFSAKMKPSLLILWLNLLSGFETSRVLWNKLFHFLLRPDFYEPMGSMLRMICKRHFWVRQNNTLWDTMYQCLTITQLQFSALSWLNANYIFSSKSDSKILLIVAQMVCWHCPQIPL